MKDPAPLAPRLVVGLFVVGLMTLGLGTSKCRKDDPVPPLSSSCEEARATCEATCHPEEPTYFFCNEATGHFACGCNVIFVPI